MPTRNNVSQLEHDGVVRTSSRTYGKMEEKGYLVSVNPDGEKNRYVGGELNPRYPDVIVWLPDKPGSSSGKAAIIEEIETADSVTAGESKQWKDYGSLGIKFLLIVPRGYAKEAADIADSENVNVTEIWVYYSEGGNIKFEKYR